MGIHQAGEGKPSNFELKHSSNTLEYTRSVGEVEVTMRVSKKILLRVLTTSLFVSTMVGTTTSARADGGNFRQHANDRVAAIIAALPPSCSHATHTVVDRKPDGSPVIGVDGTVGENTFLDVECPTGVPVAKLAHTNPPTIPTNPVYRASTTSPLRAGITSCANHGGAVMNLRVTSRSKSTPKARLREVGSFQLIDPLKSRDASSTSWYKVC